jgi:hypothetical protein
MAMTLKKSLMLGVIAEESSKTKKARRKLKERLVELEKSVTPEALEKKSQEVHRRIARHASDRVSVEKDISLFDGNQNPAKPSRAIAKLAEELSEVLDNQGIRKNKKKK